MNRTLLALFVIIIGFGACKKTTDPLIQYNAQKAIDDKLIQDYLKANNLTAQRTDSKSTDTSGVYYIIKPGEEGIGNDLFTSSTQVTVGYTGRILTSQVVIAHTDNFHPSYRLSDVMRGWQLGIPLMKKNGKIRLFIPSRYAYGPYAQDSLHLPANSVLDFDIQLYNVIN
ncbi:FKBP-type peptidyl-prolyl cis-trans isomerase [Mucilaginibacter lappiensis]|uniref:Peptidyl-prolyl cis-trans isomerase n=1 Tax=Mucilaginibacter lappiensis TaxID=354630 RepID=A0A1N7FEM6_9SPHI|nr:FKBP-type peptidyl-prolyl cis-trans isomerase [Mucilaginibacter lappiensis]MBB6112220.1 FKBP-type peptidyl-prolyl cis-trans isomerase FkpA [Mucilaginibacter lappiensis]MBB6129041.1 FKBP-type peptidyl-prolyl cis-trans isomerase FkpA [Mucilaginibacter lappiensis]SIR98676.1 FKBP-type peptidyl-prolyl cis-trans isomerase [Mucilaginibacter lappiensis]